MNTICEAEKEEQKECRYNPDDVLTIAMDTCEYMLECGAEIHRVEDTAERICRAYGADRVEIFAMTSLIVTTIVMSDGKTCTQARRVYGNSNDLAKIEKLNALSRCICRDTPDPRRVRDEIKDIRRRHTHPYWLRYIGGVLGAFGFALFFGGTVLDAAISALVGLLICFLDFNRPNQLNQIAYTVIESAMGSLIITLIGRFWGEAWNLHTAAISSGVIMLLIPGMALGNAVRDLLCGEVVSGAVKMLQCILIAGAIAAGFTGVMLLLDSSTTTAVTEVSSLTVLLSTVLGGTGFCVLFGVPPKRTLYAVIGGILCAAAYETVMGLNISDAFNPILVASIAGGVLVTCYAEAMARIQKTPTTVFLIPGLIPLVPGGSLYYTMAYLVQGNDNMAKVKGLDTLYVCVGLSIGIVLVSVLFQVFMSGKNYPRHRREIKQEKRGNQK